MIVADYWVAAWYAVVTVVMVWYAAFSAYVYRRRGGAGALYSVGFFGSIALGTLSVCLVRLFGIAGVPGSATLWFGIQRSSYIGVAIFGWWLVDYRLMLIDRNGDDIPLRRLWRFWNLLKRGDNDG